jgi:hypothetical protein
MFVLLLSNIAAIGLRKERVLNHTMITDVHKEFHSFEQNILCYFSAGLLQALPLRI